MNIIVRPLRKSDRDQMFSLATNFFKKDHWRDSDLKRLSPMIKYKDYDKHLKEDLRQYMKLNPKKAAIFVVEDNGRLIGYIYGRIERRPKMVLDVLGIIEDYFVEKPYRGKGISDMLWKKMMEWFREKKCKRLDVQTYPGNKHALKLYHKYGFVDKQIVMTKKFK
jgi:GNAT superfamily N-acetyltransferase